MKRQALAAALALGICAVQGAQADSGQEKQKEKEYFVAGIAAFEVGAKECGWEPAKVRKAGQLVAEAEKAIKVGGPGSLMGFKEYVSAKAARSAQIRDAMKDGKIRSQICGAAEEAL